MRATLLLPPFALFAGEVGTLARWVARGDRAEKTGAGREAALRSCFQLLGTSMPVAALTRSIDMEQERAPVRDNAQWLRCDPAYLIADAVTLRLLACGDIGQSSGEAEQLAQVLKPLFGDAGFTLEVTRSDRWYLRCPREARLPKFSAPGDALGDDLARHLPEGDNAVRWRSLLNEAQITLTQHPLNAQRMQRGMPPINSVWLWGAGVLPEWVRCEFSGVHTNDDVAIALARLAQIEASGDAAPVLRSHSLAIFPLGDASAVLASVFSSPSQQAGEKMPESGSSPRQLRTTSRGAHSQQVSPPTTKALRESEHRLIDIAHLRDIDSLERDWLAPLDVALKRKRISRLNLSFESGERVIVKPADRWRIWRKIKPLA